MADAHVLQKWIRWNPKITDPPMRPFERFNYFKPARRHFVPVEGS
jgi:hypothetical protein